MVLNVEKATDRLHSRRARFTRAAINIGTGVATAFALKSSAPLPEMPSFLTEPAGYTEMYHGEYRNRMNPIKDQSPVTASRPSVAPELRPSPVAESPIPLIGLSILAGIPVGGAVVGALKDKSSRARGAFKGGMGGLMLDGVLACAMTTPTPTPEIRPAEIMQFESVSGEQVRNSMQVWVDANKPFPDGNIIQDVDLDGKIFAPYFDPPAEVISADMRSVGWVRLGQMETSQNGQLQYQPLLIWNDGTSVRALATGSATAIDSATVRANLVDSAGNIIGFQETSTDLTHPFIRLQIKNPNDATGSLVPYSLKSQNQDQIQQYLTFAKFTTGSIEVNVTPTVAVASTVEAPSPMPPKLLSVDASKPFGEWDMTGFTQEQQGFLKLAVEDPWHAPIEAKNFFDLVRSQGIAEQTGDQSYAAPLPEESAARAQEANRRVGNYAEWMFSHGIREASSPIPFAWRQANLGDSSNYPIVNTAANPGYLVEGYEWYRNNPGTYTLQWLTSRTGFQLNQGGMTQEIYEQDLSRRQSVGHNDTRDTIFGEPFFITGPTRGFSVQGDLMVLFPIAGTPADTAEEAVIRTYDATGIAKYAFIRMQFAEQTVKTGDTSCMSIPLDPSIACPVGTVLKPVHLSQWDDARRETNISANRAKMLEFMNMQIFTHPIRIYTEGNVWTGDPRNVFMDGAPTPDDIKIPTVPPEFFK